tara:strand:- start:1017 stop:1400 length:384 start_codon:yes stop_codon:yes gene_type:complete
MSGFHEYVQSLDFNDIPESAQLLVKNSLLDTLSIIATSKGNNTNTTVRKFVSEHYPKGQHEARIVFDGRAVSPLGVAWAGGFAADSLDGHEGHFLSKGHAGATVVPGLLALVDAYRDQGRTVSDEAF